jgi:hypothetical protein
MTAGVMGLFGWLLVMALARSVMVMFVRHGCRLYLSGQTQGRPEHYTSPAIEAARTARYFPQMADIASVSGVSDLSAQK